MIRAHWPRFALSALFCCSALACGPTQDRIEPFNRDGGPDFSAFGLPCPNPPPDTDGDGISDHDEGADETPPRDTDLDGIPDFRDLDSDSDGIPDFLEGRNGNACTPPVDSDKDGIADFRDLDSDDANDSTVPDSVEAGPNPTAPLDTNGNGIYDYLDPDNDGDGIPDILEMTPAGATHASKTLAEAPDTDGDGTPDYLDVDSDNDTISDKTEGYTDTDGDLIANYRDSDSDGDCVPDRAEAGDDNLATAPIDTDGDGAPDYLDIDTDNDGLTDGQEDKNCSGSLEACETSRVLTDTDGDGARDLVEYETCASKDLATQMQTQCACDGQDSSKTPFTRGNYVFIMEYQKAPSPTRDLLSLATDVSQADVVFAVDSSSTMQAVLDNLAGGVAQLVSKVKMRIPDVAFGVFEFRDLGLPHNDPASSPANIPSFRYAHRVQTTRGAGFAALQNALQALVALRGGDPAEAGWAALFTLATTATRSIAVTASTTYTLFTNPGLLTLSPGEVGGTGAGAGFRAGALPVIITISNAEWHDAPGSFVPADGESGKNTYPSTMGDVGNTPACNPCTNVPSRRDAMTALQNIGARVIGLAAIGSSTFNDPKARAIKVAQETGALVAPGDFGATGVRPAGCASDKCCTGLDVNDNVIGENAQAGQCPLAFTVNANNGSAVGDSIVAGVTALAVSLRFDVHVEAHDVDPNTVDNFLFRLEPNLTGIGPAALCVTTPPAPLQDKYSGPKSLAGADGVDDTFPGLRGGNQVCFDIVPKMNTAVPATNKPQVFRARVQVRGVSGSSGFDLGASRELLFIVPPVIANKTTP